MRIRNRKIRVAHLVNDLGPAGKESGILKLMNNLNPNTFDSSAVVFRNNQEREFLDLQRIKIIDLNHSGGNDMRLPYRISRILKTNNFDIIHTHAWGTLIEGIIGAKMAGVPIIIHGEHGTFPEQLAHRYLQHIFWRMADRLLSVSSNLGKKLASTTGFPLNRIKVIYNGVDDRKFYPSTELRHEFRQKFNFGQNDWIVGTVGRFNAVKNYPMLLRAAVHLIKNGEQFQVIFVGGGREESHLRKLAAELSITKFVHFLGFQNHINMFLNGMDTFVLTSFSEGCSNVIQEAMFAQKSIIATDVGGNSELLSHRETGLLVESNNHLQLAEWIQQVKHNPEFGRKLAQNARKFAVETFSLPAMIKAYEDLYLEAYHKKFPERVLGEAPAL